MAIENRAFQNQILKTVQNTISTYKMFQHHDNVLVGVSGGPDSVALLDVLYTIAPRYPIKLGIAHINHGLREKDSDRDANFVENLAKKLNLPYFNTKVNIHKYQKEHKLSTEEAARNLRYTFYEKLSKENGFNKIALGHHLDDNAELVLMFLIRGSGFKGLSGIPPVRDKKIVRPLIRLTRSNIIKFLLSRNLTYRIDKSNQNECHLRNQIRHSLIPKLETSYNPNISQTLNRLAHIARSEDELIEEKVSHLFQSYLLNSNKKNEVHLSLYKLNNTHIALQRRIFRMAIKEVKGDLKRISFEHIEKALNLLKKAKIDSSIHLPDGVRLHLTKNALIFKKGKKGRPKAKNKKESKEKISFKYTIKSPRKIYLKIIDAYLDFKEMKIQDLPRLKASIKNDDPNIAFFDGDLVEFPLTLRNVQPGDRFNPLGMKGTQKVKDYFINNKIDKDKRGRCPIIISDKKIIWLAGYQIADRVKITSATRNVLKARFFLRKRDL